MNKQTLKGVIFTGLFLIPFVPFLVSSSLFFPFITTKAFTWRIIIEIIFAAWALLALQEATFRPKKSPILYGLGVFLLVIGTANIFGVSPTMSFWSNFERMEGFITLLHLGMFYLVISSLFNEKNWRNWWNTSLVASAMMVFYCLFQLGGTVQISQGGVRVDGTFGNATYLAVYLLVHVFVAIFYAYREKKGSALRWVYGLLILGQLTILYHTATRGAILGLIGGVLVTALLNLWNKENKVARKAALGALGALILIVGGFFALKDTGFVKNSPVLSRFSSISTEELKSGGRSFVWPIAIEGIKEKPILGWGQENFIYVFQKHYSPDMIHLEPWFDRAHNIFLDWAVAGGLLGLLAYLSLYGAFLYIVWRKDEGLDYLDKTILTGLLAAYFFHNLFVFDHLISYVLFFSLLGYVSSRSNYPVLGEGRVGEKNIPGVIVGTAAILLVIALYFVNIKPLSTNSSLLRALDVMRSGNQALAVESFQKSFTTSSLGRVEAAEQISANATSILNSSLPPERKNEFLSFARSAIAKIAKKYEDNARVQIMAGSFFSSTGSINEGEAYLKRALELSPGKQQIYMELGTNYINAGRAVEGLELFKKAYEMAPQYRESKLVYLLGSIYAGNSGVERQLLTEFTEREIIFEDRVISAYYNSKRFAEVIIILEKRKILDPENSPKYDELIKQVREQIQK